MIKIKKFRHNKATLLLDFDGTLAPIVRRPHLAKISPSLRRKISKLAKKKQWTVGVISGRDLKTVRAKMKLSHLIYAGNHGYEIQFPKRKIQVHPAAIRSRALIQKLSKELKSQLKSIPGALIENKGWSLSLHTRTLKPSSERKAVKIFTNVVRRDKKKRKIKITQGKKVWEVRPPANWNKGKAVQYVLSKIKKPGFPIYMGDDVTDEDAFKVLKKRGLGVRVGRKGRTRAHFSIPSVKHVPKLLNDLEKLVK